MDYLPCVEVNPSCPSNATVIWLHGLGANGHDFESIVPELKLPASAAIRFLFPHAPAIPVTCNDNRVMPAWYDIASIDINQDVDEKRLLHSTIRISELIDREVSRQVDSSRIVIAGFSQGGSVGYQAALSYSQPLAGLIAMSTYIASEDLIEYNQANVSLPIQIYHGTLDPVVPETLGQAAYDIMQRRGYLVRYQTYLMEHQVCAAQISHISAWLQQVLLS